MDEVSKILDANPTLLQKRQSRTHSPLAMAARAGHLGVVTLLVQRGADIQASVHRKTALCWAAAEGHAEIVRFLLSQGPLIDARDDIGSTHGPRGGQPISEDFTSAFREAFSWGHLAVMLAFLQHAEMRTREEMEKVKWTRLMQACAIGQLGAVQTLVQQVGRQGLEEGDGEQRTALHWAARHGHEEVVSFLLGSGATVMVSDCWQRTPFMHACLGGHLGVMRTLLTHVEGHGRSYAEYEVQEGLRCAVRGGHEETVAFLLSHGTQASDPSRWPLFLGQACGGMDDGKDPLMIACEKGHMGLVRMLLQQLGGQGLEARDATRPTALHCAAYGGHEEIARLLLSVGAQANARYTTGSPFMWAVRCGHLGVAKMLAEHLEGQEGQRLDVDEMDHWSKRPLHHAAKDGHVELVAFLLSKGARAYFPDEYYVTPLMYAAKQGHLEVVRMLAEHREGKERGPFGMWGVHRDDEYSALRQAIEEGHDEVAAFVLSRHKVGMTYLMQASQNGDIGMVDVLLQHLGGEGLDERDARGKSALHYAAEEGHAEVMRRLLLAGADYYTIRADRFDRRRTLHEVARVPRRQRDADGADMPGIFEVSADMTCLNNAPCA